jgi:GWxTD domain-containing protein
MKNCNFSIFSALIKLLRFKTLFIVLLFYGCVSTNHLNTLNLSKTYDKESQLIELSHVVFNNNDSLSTVYYSIKSSDLLFIKGLKNKTFISEYSVKYELFTTGNSKNPIDTATFRFIDSVNYNKNVEIIDSLYLPVKFPVDYNLLLTLTDKNKGQKYNYLINIRKSDRNNRQNYLIRDEKGLPLMKNYTNGVELIYVCSNSLKFRKFYVDYYDKKFPISQPPHIPANEQLSIIKPDSSYIINFLNATNSKINFPNKGFYHIRIDSSLKDGITLFNFYNEFPEIESPERMLFPLKYITTKTEYDDLVQEKNTKAAVDNFWIDKAGNSDRAKELIRKFYNRVQSANTFFSSYIEGWKTDRGMIYIVFGPPNYIYRSANVETWIYGEENNILSLSFNFNKVANPFTDNDYSLVREAGYRDSWYAAIETWRK